MTLYTALGDSITAGVGASGPQFAYPGRVVHMLNERRTKNRTLGEVLAEPGWTSQVLASAVRDNASIFLTSAQTITIWVGGDDLVHGALAGAAAGPSRFNMHSVATSIQRYGTYLTLLIKYIRTQSKVPIILCTQYNPFPNSALASQGIAALNHVTIRVAHGTGCIIAPTHAWFAGRQAQLIAGYQTGRIEDALHATHAPVHPNDRGHAVIAAGLYPLLAPFQQP